MATFDSPIEICPMCDEYVLLDQTQKECADEHKCRNIDCPLKEYFEGMDFKEGQKADQGM